MKQLDWWLLAAALGLTTIGIEAIHVATPPAQGLAARQFAWAAIAAMALLLTALPHFHHCLRLAYLAYALSIPLLIAVYWTEPINGAQRWLRFGPVGVQPSELAKIAFVLALARHLSGMKAPGEWWRVGVSCLLAAIPMALILKQPDLGTALLFPIVLLAMLYGAGLGTRHLALLLVGVMVMAPFLWKAMSLTQRSRITGFLRQTDTGARPRDGGYQLYQSKLMVALGGTTGSTDAAEVHLPFDHTDFIFSVIAGHWGLAGVTLTFSLFALLLWRGLRIALRAEEPFGRLATLGLVVMLAIQGSINLAMTVGLAPVTGLTLPFVSYGGSSLVTCFVSIGLILNIHGHCGDPWRLDLSHWESDWLVAAGTRS